MWKTHWLTSGECGYPLDNGPILAVGQPHSSLKNWFLEMWFFATLIINISKKACFRFTQILSGFKKNGKGPGTCFQSIHTLRIGLKNIFHKIVYYLTKFGNETNAANIYFFKINNRNARKRSEICSKLAIKTPERHQWRRSGVFIVNFEHISHLLHRFWTSKY